MDYPWINLNTRGKAALDQMRPAKDFGKHRDLARREPVLYCIVHKPTSAVYFGHGMNCDVAFNNWRSRLKALLPANNLNWAFRALYTCRADFFFKVIGGPYPKTTHVDTLDAAVANAVRSNREKNGIAKDLNAENSTLNYWLGRCPEGEKWRILQRIDYLLGSKPARTARRKQRLVPGKFLHPELSYIAELPKEGKS